MTDLLLDDDYLEINLREPEQVASRLLVLNATVQRVVLEESIELPGTHEQSIEHELFDLRAALLVAGADGEVSPRERVFLETPAGGLGADELYDFAWDLEALDILLSTCGLRDPRLPSLAPPAGEQRLELFDDQTPSVARLAGMLRIPSLEEVSRQREIVELWHWRVDAEQLLRNSFEPERTLAAAVILDVIDEAQEAGLITTGPDGDFDYGDRHISEWSDEEVPFIEIAFASRLRAMNWLCGFGANWDEAPVLV